MNMLRRILLIVGGYLLGASFLAAQQVSPAVSEYQGVAASSKVEGHFDLSNDSMNTLYITIEAKSFTINPDGNAVFTPLKSEIHLELSSTSLRLGPKQRRTVYYRVSGPGSPAWFCIYSNFSGLPRRNGMDLQLELPHTVYLYGKNRTRAEQLAFVDLKQSPGHVTGRITNHSANIVRLTGLDVSGEHFKKTEGGFPLLPGGVRDIDLVLPDSRPAQALRARAAGFHIETLLP